MTEKNKPTQTERPHNAVLRTIIAAAIGLLPILPEISRAAGVAEWPWVVTALGITGAVTRVLALPAVEQWLQDYVPWLSAYGRYHGEHRLDDRTKE